MAKLTTADAVRQLGISHTAQYKLIDQGKVSAMPDGLIDQAELIRAAPTWRLLNSTLQHCTATAVAVHPSYTKPIGALRLCMYRISLCGLGTM